MWNRIRQQDIHTRFTFSTIPRSNDVMIAWFLLTYVMGMMKVFGVEKSYSHNGAHSKMIHIELDYDVTLFETYVDELNTIIASGEIDNVVVAVLMTKIKIFQSIIIF
ncbi:transmembrane protein, putative [Medicago truncatula]|uniref:Transmembrane protein, putative n=1 Tax=Medicago truncatula TaxID=3880 RepID=A0A072VV62_MEDTR|nr:transmembrane protein, putative [Medicago truncatula]